MGKVKNVFRRLVDPETRRTYRFFTKALKAYQAGMQVTSYKELYALHLAWGVCYWAARHNISQRGKIAHIIDKYVVREKASYGHGFWCVTPNDHMKVCSNIEHLKEACLAPRIAILEKIVKELS